MIFDRFAVAFLVIAPCVVLAQGDSRKPSSAEIVKRLQPQPQFTARGISVEGGRQKPAPAPSLDLEVNFAYDSAELTTDAKLVLDNRITGHTDGAGSEQYNLQLSKRRAAAVVDYLVRVNGVERSRLQIEGKGKSELLDPANPLAAVNRRVQVINLSTE
jgi:outer membrane protein OmpA-like peptidoglycan-associated protein